MQKVRGSNPLSPPLAHTPLAPLFSVLVRTADAECFFGSVDAVFYGAETPAQWKDFYWSNAKFFTNLGSPGGARSRQDTRRPPRGGRTAPHAISGISQPSAAADPRSQYRKVV
jgi:hypothetical protein